MGNMLHFVFPIRYDDLGVEMSILIVGSECTVRSNLIIELYSGYSDA